LFYIVVVIVVIFSQDAVFFSVSDMLCSDVHCYA